MAPLNDPLPGGNPPPEPVTREPWELVFDVVLIGGAAILLWNALVVAGWVPGKTILLLEAYSTLALGPRDWTFFIGLTLVGLAEIPAYYVILNSRKKTKTELTPEVRSMWLKLLLVLALMPWVYLLALYLCPPNGS